MRRFIYMCFCLLMIACSKESTLESRINLDELYVIQDDPDDPVSIGFMKFMKLMGYRYISMIRSGGYF